MVRVVSSAMEWGETKRTGWPCPGSTGGPIGVVSDTRTCKQVERESGPGPNPRSIATWPPTGTVPR